MLATVPGAQQDANGNVSVGGGLPSQVQYSVDGSSTVNIRQNGALGNMNPSTELIGEFKVTQFNNNAEFAQVGDVTISTKSGTDQFHGSAFEYMQNDALDARVWNTDDKPHKAVQYIRRKPGRTGEAPQDFERQAADLFLRGFRGEPAAFLDAVVFVCADAGDAVGRFLGVVDAADGSIHRETLSGEQDSERQRVSPTRVIASIRLQSACSTIICRRRIFRTRSLGCRRTTCSKHPPRATPMDSTSRDRSDVNRKADRCSCGGVGNGSTPVR